MNKETPLEVLNKIAGITNYDGGKNLKALGNSHKKEFSLLESTLKDYEELVQKYNELLYNYQELVHCGLKSEQKKLKAFEIIINIIKHTSHFRLKERQNFGEDEMSYYLVIGYGMSECEYKLKNKEEYDTLKEILS